jgi:very-short-patch-repair endonuclease
MRHQSRIVGRVIAGIADAAKGIVTRAELLDAGVTRDQIIRRIRGGHLFPEFDGVYRVGHRAPSPEATYMAAVKACGEGALLAGRAAAWLLGLIKGAPPPAEVVTPSDRRIRGIRIHRSRVDLTPDAWKWRGIPVTKPARTLVDVAAFLSLDDLARACHEAGVRHGTTPRDVDEVLARRPKSQGAKNLRRVLHGDVHVTLSELERRFLQHVREIRRPRPITNKVAAGGRVDCHWPDHKLIVELDSYRYHSSRHAWEADRRRERAARAAGNEFRRYTYGDVFEHPRLMRRELCELLPSNDPIRPKSFRT